MIANNRLHMANLLDDRMRRVASPDAPSKKNRDVTPIKTFIVEAVLPEDAEPQNARRFIDTVFPRLSGKHFGAMTLHPAKDDSVVTVQTIVDEDPITAYLDFSNPRFWLLHSMSDSDSLDRLVSHWINDLPELDRAWFPVGLLNLYSLKGKLRGIGLDYSNKWYQEAKYAADVERGDPSSYNESVFKMQLRSRQAGRVLKTMQSEHGEPHSARLSKVSVEIDGSISDIKYDGKVTGRGKSFTHHVATTSSILDTYAEQIRLVERNYAIAGVKDGTGITLSGSPITFKLPTPIEDLKVFCDAMFSASEPFRLWGDPVRVSDRLYRIHGLDLHSARTLAFEVSPTFIRVYLPRGSCGNSVLRLYTNLQARYDALVTAVSNGGESVFGF